jgi:hypothetical protein
VDLPWIEIPIDGSSRQRHHLETDGSWYQLRFSRDASLTHLAGFMGWQFLAKVEIPNSVQSFANQVFHICHFLTEIVFEPESCLKQICGFQFCRSLLKVEIPASVEVVETYAFHQSHSLGELTFARGSRLRVLNGFVGLSSLPRISIPPTVVTMNLQPFHGCRLLVEVILENAAALDRFPDLLSCFSLRRIEIGGDPAELDPNSRFYAAFKGLIVCRGIADGWSILLGRSGELHLIDEPPMDFASIPEFVNRSGKSLKISTISDRLFCICQSRSISIPPFIGTIESSFSSIENCPSILEISPSIEQIDGFLQTKGLEFLKFSPGIRLRTVRGFSCCLNLRRIEFPPMVELVDGFCQCRSLTTIVFEPESHVRIINGFNYCISLAIITIPASLFAVTGFNHCKLLNTIDLDPEGVLNDISGFDNCSSLCHLLIPKSVETISGFAKAVKLRRIIFARGSCLKSIQLRISWHDIYWEEQHHHEGVFLEYAESDLSRFRRRVNHPLASVRRKRRSVNHALASVRMTSIPGMGLWIKETLPQNH